MSLEFKCDFCSFTTSDPREIISSNALLLAKDRTGADRETCSALMPTADHCDYCNACFRQLKDWINGGLRQWAKENFPLVKGNVEIH